MPWSFGVSHGTTSAEELRAGFAEEVFVVGFVLSALGVGWILCQDNDSEVAISLGKDTIQLLTVNEGRIVH
jgi:hypothetical protein